VTVSPARFDPHHVPVVGADAGLVGVLGQDVGVTELRLRSTDAAAADRGLAWADLPGCEPPTGPTDRPDRRVFPLPDAGACLFLSKSGTTVRAVELPPLRDVAADRPVIASAPPAVAVRGRRFEYKPTVLGKAADGKLSSGPPGMRWDNGVVWDVPADFVGDEVTFTVTVGSATQRVRLAVVAKPPTLVERLGNRPVSDRSGAESPHGR
jgi:hypothetical protein